MNDRTVVVLGENRKKRAFVLVCLLLLIVNASIIYLLFPQNTSKYRAATRNVIAERGFRHELFLKSWYEFTSSRQDHENIERLCEENFTWSRNEAIPWFELKNRTDFNKGFVLSWNINPAKEFSSITLQTQHVNSDVKRSGGDHWRVQIKGPSSFPVLKKDLRNGSYEFQFLPVSPGTYSLHVSLEYTLCAGLKEPPIDWFKLGTVQGKEQKQGSLHRDLPFINQPLWSGSELKFTVPALVHPKIQSSVLNDSCSSQPSCNMLWNGYGSWLTKFNWMPLCASSTELRYAKKSLRNGVLWIFGDSVSSQFYHNVKANPLCSTIFQRCMYTYNWLYSLENYNSTLKRYVRQNTTVEKMTWDNNDYDVRRIIDELRQVLLHPAMHNKDSVLLLNYGLHFTESLNYTNFKTTIDNVIQLLHNEANCRVIWRTTTSLNRHKYSQPNLHARRFMTTPRVELYNSYANKRFCEHNFDVLDVYPLTDSYPGGTGSIKTPHDPVHYEYHVMKPVEKLLERVFAIT